MWRGYCVIGPAVSNSGIRKTSGGDYRGHPFKDGGNRTQESRRRLRVMPNAGFLVLRVMWEKGNKEGVPARSLLSISPTSRNKCFVE